MCFLLGKAGYNKPDQRTNIWFLILRSPSFRLSALMGNRDRWKHRGTFVGYTCTGVPAKGFTEPGPGKIKKACPEWAGFFYLSANSKQ